MAVHQNIMSLLRESVSEYIYIADYCVSFIKDSQRGPQQTGGCLGYPAAVMLFSIIDVIGSFHRQDLKCIVNVDGKNTIIRKGGFQHFYILNSPYYGQSLGEQTIRKLYDNFRNSLFHNAALPPGNFLTKGPGDIPFPIINGKPSINLIPFLALSKKAVDMFLNNLERIVPGSEQEALIYKK
jgi:hypothetical protein